MDRKDTLRYLFDYSVRAVDACNACFDDNYPLASSFCPLLDVSNLVTLDLWHHMK